MHRPNENRVLKIEEELSPSPAEFPLTEPEAPSEGEDQPSSENPRRLTRLLARRWLSREERRKRAPRAS